MNEKFHAKAGTLDEMNVPEIIYKYRTWSDKWHKLFISEREVFLASADTFEDELDCKNPIRYDLLTDEQWFQFFIYQSNLRSPEFSDEEHIKEAKYQMLHSNRKDPSFIHKVMNMTVTEYYDKEGILCLTENFNNEGMWNKYADKGKGICIGYNTKELLKYLGSCNKVKYVNELPIILPIPHMEFFDIIDKRVYHKLNKWSFEEEFRALQFWEEEAQLDDRKIKLPRSAYNRVILGNNMIESEKVEITAIIKKNIGDINIIERINAK